MRALLQVVSKAQVSVNHRVVGACSCGFCIFLGVEPADTKATADKLWHKISNLRVFPDETGKLNRSLHDIEGQVLIISQFTLYASVKHGNRPSFTEAAGHTQATELYDYVCELARKDLGAGNVSTGVFGADMSVELANEGPCTIWIDTDQL